VEVLGGRALVLPADVADAAALDQAAMRTEEAFGPLDVWINNAMVSVFSPIRDMTPEEYRRVTEVTYLGVVRSDSHDRHRSGRHECDGYACGEGNHPMECSVVSR
jgi:NAD(P)-dependent dehydrogenase (short-subunit alcohol dehydrogenase family)